ncbi:hypothetical protein SDJN02_06996 [Cucurbita argyrosperma subsp. argyrosperma]|nr:hypothetical protein SDJN02_06996 [Cucurbita argyrosperma subsp. argyrosperma]
MQCRRREDYYVRESESMKLHAQDRLHLDHGRYVKPRREALDRSPRLRRSLSPHRIGDSWREVGLGQRVDTIERRDEDWRLRTGRNSDIGSSVHSYGQTRERPNYDEVFLHNDHRQLSELQRTHVLSEPRKISAEDEFLDYNQDLRYMHDDLRIRIEREINRGKWSDGSGQRRMNQKLLAAEEGETAMGSYNSHLDMVPASIYRDFLPSSQSLGMGSLNNERFKYRDDAVSDKSQGADYHEVEPNHRFHSRNIEYSASSGFYSRKYESSLSRPLTGRCLESYQDGQYLQISDEFSERSHGDFVDTKEFNSYRKRTLVDSAMVGGKRNLTPHQQGTNSSRREHGSYFYSKPEGTVNDSYEGPSRVMQKITQTRNYIDYDSAIVSGRGDFSRPKVSNDSLLKLPNVDDSYANHRTGIALDCYRLRKQTVLDYPDIELTKAVNHGSEYVGTGSIHLEVGRRVTQNYEESPINPSQYCQKSHARSDYGSEREVGPHLLKERLHESSMFKCDGEAYRNTESLERMTEGVCTYNLKDRVPKRKYFEEDRNLLDRRIGTSCDYMPSKVVDLYNSGEEWMEDETNRRYTSRKAKFDHNKYRKPNKKYDRHNLYASDDSFLRESYLDNAKKYETGPKYMKGNKKQGTSSWIKSQNVDRRNSLHKQHKVWNKAEGENGYVYLNDDDLSDDLVIPTESEPPEDSEKFNQMVHEAFLKCLKMLNMKASVRKRYKDQGNGGSLYCIVCGRSYSKEFLDTQRLVKHAYMSHKIGLRARHLGLAKAICVLMGWNSALPQDTVTWVPEDLHKEEAVVQKEDLIIWPPVVIVRNISMSCSNPGKWKVITIEALEAFLRSKNLLKGRVKMSLGCPADQSVMVLKFLPTFSGLTDAERLNKFFLEKRHGRVNFEQSKGDNGRANDVGEATKGNKIEEEEVLYGYLGIAEDLDSVEFNIRKSSSIKSKKEILEL